MADFLEGFSPEEQVVIKKAAQRRLGQSEEFNTRQNDSGQTVLVPTFRDRMELSGFGDIDASDEMAAVQKQLNVLRDAKAAQAYVKANKDEYPSLADYQGGKAGAIALKKKEDKLRGGETLLEGLGLSTATLNSYIRESGLTELDLDKRYTSAELAPYITQYNKQVRADEREPGLKLQRDALKETRDARIETNQRLTQAQEDNAALARYNIDYKKWSDQEATKRREHELRVRQAEGKADRTQTFDLAVMQMENNRADRQYRREADERQARRDDRKDRQLMILQLIKGLQQMGNAIAI